MIPYRQYPRSECSTIHAPPNTVTYSDRAGEADDADDQADATTNLTDVR
jgi:hypothetical protein